MSKSSIIIGALLVPGVAAAHPEHIPGVQVGLAHYLTDPFHIALTSAAACLCLAGCWLLQRRLARANQRAHV